MPITGPVAYIPDAIPLSFSLNHVATSFGDPEEAIGPPKLNKPTDSNKDIQTYSGAGLHVLIIEYLKNAGSVTVCRVLAGGGYTYTNGTNEPLAIIASLADT